MKFYKTDLLLGFFTLLVSYQIKRRGGGQKAALVRF